jgi:hypothetical protein
MVDDLRKSITCSSCGEEIKVHRQTPKEILEEIRKEERKR